MIKGFKHKGLSELFGAGPTRRVRQDLKSRSLRRLEAMDQAEVLNDLNVPGFNFRGLHGVPKGYSIHVNGRWCITVKWKERVRCGGLILNNITEVNQGRILHKTPFKSTADPSR
jgi:proteic killer suppression protein